jgi:hypothetical protein
MKSRAHDSEVGPSVETKAAPAAKADAAPEQAIEALAAIGVTPALPPERAPAEAFGQLALARVLEVREGDLEINVGGQMMTARSAPHVAVEVLRTACERGEPVLVERAPSGDVLVVGALRTQATPGVDKMEHVAIEADRIELKGRKEISLATSGVAQIALRAAGEIETYADRIVSRAEELHKIVGRMLRLN